MFVGMHEAVQVLDLFFFHLCAEQCRYMDHEYQLKVCTLQVTAVEAAHADLNSYLEDLKLKNAALRAI